MSWKERAMNALSARSLLSYEPADTSGPILEITIGDALRAAAAAWPDRPALIEGLSKRALRRRWTFTQALQEGENAGQALGQRFRPDEHVAIWAANLPEWFFAQFGAALAGLTLVTVNPSYLAAELAYVLKQSRACGISCRTITAGATCSARPPKRERRCRPYAK
jgi:fatty-acyl-CoA synthase